MQLHQKQLCQQHVLLMSKHKTFWPQGYLQGSEHKRIHVNGCPRMGVIVFSLLSFFQLKPSLHSCGAPRQNSLARGYYTIPGKEILDYLGYLKHRELKEFRDMKWRGITEWYDSHCCKSVKHFSNLLTQRISAFLSHIHEKALKSQVPWRAGNIQANTTHWSTCLCICERYVPRYPLPIV